MGWNDHVEWQLEYDFEMLRDHFMFQELEDDQIEELWLIVEKVMWGRKITPAEQKRFDEEFEPLRSKIDDLELSDAFWHAVEKDD